jgi:transposase
LAQRQLGFGAAAVTVRVVEPPPGEVARGRLRPVGTVARSDDGTPAPLVTLGYSRYAFLWLCLRQDLQTVLDGLEAAWRFFGGVPRRLVVDNLKAVVTRADRYAPTIARVFLEYAQYRGFVVDPAVPRHATGKPKVERGIPYVRQDFFRGEHFLDLADMQARATVWCRDLAGTRVHGTTRQAPGSAARAAATGPGALRSPDVGTLHGPSRSPHPVPSGPVLRADALHRSGARGAGR